VGHVGASQRGAGRSVRQGKRIAGWIDAPRGTSRVAIALPLTVQSGVDRGGMGGNGRGSTFRCDLGWLQAKSSSLSGVPNSAGNRFDSRRLHLSD
jgi:hypothetical protein